MKIEILMLKKNRHIEKFKVNPNKPHFVWHSGLYYLTKSVNTQIVSGKIKTIPQLIFFENNPKPVQELAEEKEYLEYTVMENAIKSVAESRVPLMERLAWLGKLKSKDGMILIFILLIIYAIIMGGGI